MCVSVFADSRRETVQVADVRLCVVQQWESRGKLPMTRGYENGWRRPKIYVP